MVLSLIRPRRPADPAPAPLSPARVRLKSHIEELEAAADRAQLLGAARRALTAAESRARESEAGVDAVAELEAAALDRWAADPAGPMPPPLVDLRGARVADLADAHAAVVEARRAADGIAPALLTAQREHAALVDRTVDLTHDVLFEIAVELVERYDRHARVARACLANIQSLITMLQVQNRVAAVERVIAIGRGGTLAEAAALREGRRIEEERMDKLRRERWPKVFERLMTDPAATLDVDGDPSREDAT